MLRILSFFVYFILLPAQQPFCVPSELEIFEVQSHFLFITQQANCQNLWESWTFKDATLEDKCECLGVMSESYVNEFGCEMNILTDPPTQESFPEVWSQCSSQFCESNTADWCWCDDSDLNSYMLGRAAQCEAVFNSWSTADLTAKCICLRGQQQPLTAVSECRMNTGSPWTESESLLSVMEACDNLVPTSSPDPCVTYLQSPPSASPTNCNPSCEFCEAELDRQRDEIEILQDRVEALTTKQDECAEFNLNLEVLLSALAGELDYWRNAVQVGGLPCDFIPPLYCDDIDECGYFGGNCVRTAPTNHSKAPVSLRCDYDPTVAPTASIPSVSPTLAPTNPTKSPVVAPTAAPTKWVSMSPTPWAPIDCSPRGFAGQQEHCWDRRFTCDSCCFTGLDRFGDRDCWTRQWDMLECCGKGFLSDFPSISPSDHNPTPEPTEPEEYICPANIPYGACSGSPYCEYLPVTCCANEPDVNTFIAECVRGYWSCTIIQCGACGPSSCPSQLPVNGTACTGLQSCDYNPATCCPEDPPSPQNTATCVNQLWTVSSHTCNSVCLSTTIGPATTMSVTTTISTTSIPSISPSTTALPTRSTTESTTSSSQPTLTPQQTIAPETSTTEPVSGALIIVIETCPADPSTSTDAPEVAICVGAVCVVYMIPVESMNSEETYSFGFEGDGWVENADSVRLSARGNQVSFDELSITTSCGVTSGWSALNVDSISIPLPECGARTTSLEATTSQPTISKPTEVPSLVPSISSPTMPPASSNPTEIPSPSSPTMSPSPENPSMSPSTTTTTTLAIINCFVLGDENIQTLYDGHYCENGNISFDLPEYAFVGPNNWVAFWDGEVWMFFDLDEVLPPMAEIEGSGEDGPANNAIWALSRTTGVEVYANVPIRWYTTFSEPSTISTSPATPVPQTTKIPSITPTRTPLSSFPSKRPTTPRPSNMPSDSPSTASPSRAPSTCTNDGTVLLQISVCDTASGGSANGAFQICFSNGNCIGVQTLDPGRDYSWTFSSANPGTSFEATISLVASSGDGLCVDNVQLNGHDVPGPPFWLDQPCSESITDCACSQFASPECTECNSYALCPIGETPVCDGTSEVTCVSDANAILQQALCDDYTHVQNPYASTCTEAFSIPVTRCPSETTEECDTCSGCFLFDWCYDYDPAGTLGPRNEEQCENEGGIVCGIATTSGPSYSYLYPAFAGDASSFTSYIGNLESGMEQILDIPFSNVDTTVLQEGSAVEISYNVYDSTGQLISSYVDQDLKSDLDEVYKFVPELNILLGLASRFALTVPNVGGADLLQYEADLLNAMSASTGIPTSEIFVDFVEFESDTEVRWYLFDFSGVIDQSVFVAELSQTPGLNALLGYALETSLVAPNANALDIAAYESDLVSAMASVLGTSLDVISVSITQDGQNVIITWYVSPTHLNVLQSNSFNQELTDELAQIEGLNSMLGLVSTSEITLQVPNVNIATLQPYTQDLMDAFVNALQLENFDRSDLTITFMAEGSDVVITWTSTDSSISSIVSSSEFQVRFAEELSKIAGLNVILGYGFTTTYRATADVSELIPYESDLQSALAQVLGVDPDLISVSFSQNESEAVITFAVSDLSLAPETQTSEFQNELNIALSNIGGLNSILGLTSEYTMVFAEANPEDLAPYESDLIAIMANLHGISSDAIEVSIADGQIVWTCPYYHTYPQDAEVILDAIAGVSGLNSILGLASMWVMIVPSANLQETLNYDTQLIDTFSSTISADVDSVDISSGVSLVWTVPQRDFSFPSNLEDTLLAEFSLVPGLNEALGLITEGSAEYLLPALSSTSMEDLQSYEARLRSTFVSALQEVSPSIGISALDVSIQVEDISGRTTAAFSVANTDAISTMQSEQFQQTFTANLASAEGLNSLLGYSAQYTYRAPSGMLDIWPYSSDLLSAVPSLTPGSSVDVNLVMFGDAELDITWTVRGENAHSQVSDANFEASLLSSLSDVRDLNVLLGLASHGPSAAPVTAAPSASSPSSSPVTSAPTRFISESPTIDASLIDCTDNGYAGSQTGCWDTRFTCESCCATNRSVLGIRCWTQTFTKLQCCGNS